MANQAKDGEIQWKKTRGTLALRGGKVVGPGETFMAGPEDIPEVFRDTVVPVNPEDLLDPEAPMPPVEPEPPSYTIKSCTPGRYNVLDGQGKAVNERPMSLDDAKRLAENLG
jgi:hypothetical protein